MLLRNKDALEVDYCMLYGDACEHGLERQLGLLQSRWDEVLEIQLKTEAQFKQSIQILQEARQLRLELQGMFNNRRGEALRRLSRPPPRDARPRTTTHGTCTAHM
jgi:hypothetical protein